MSSIVADGERILAAEAARALAEAQALREAQALAELRASAPALLALFDTVCTRLAAIETRLADVHRQVLATRYRTPIRDEIGTIVGVVDEINPPIWARPIEEY